MSYTFLFLCGKIILNKYYILKVECQTRLFTLWNSYNQKLQQKYCRNYRVVVYIHL